MLIHKNIKYLQSKKSISFEKNLKKISGKKILEVIEKIVSEANYTYNQLFSTDIELLEGNYNNIKLLILDVDGVMTDGGMYYAENGDEFKKFNSKDGFAIRKLTSKNDIQVGIISSGFNKNIIQNRSKLLGISRVHHSTENKLEVLNEWIKEMKISYKNIAYIGDDINDLPIIEKVAISACPSNAVDAVKEKVKIILSKKGGEGCVREFIDNYLNYKNI